MNNEFEHYSAMIPIVIFWIKKIYAILNIDPFRAIKYSKNKIDGHVVQQKFYCK